MEITINGEKKEIGREVSLTQLLEELGMPTVRVAVELNRDVVRRRDWETTVISEGDRIEIVHFVGGG